MSGTPDMLFHMGGVPVGMEVLQPGEVRWAYSSISAAPYASKSKSATGDKLHSTIALAHAATTSGRNDVVFLTPETHSQTASIVWSNSSTHLIGMQPGKYANGVLIAQTSATSLNNMLDVSGSNNTFENLHFRHGIGTQAANLTCLRVTGDGNTFKNCWFEGPCDNSVADLATARLVSLAGANNTFQNCHFGGTWVPRSAAGALVEYTNTTYEATFEDCVFNSWVDATTPVMFYIKLGKASGIQYYTRCTFAAHSTNLGTAMANLFYAAGSDSTGMHIFRDCQCYNITSIDYTDGANWPGLSMYWNNYTVTAATAGRAIVATG